MGDYFSAASYYRNYAENYKAADNREEALFMEAISLREAERPTTASSSPVDRAGHRGPRELHQRATPRPSASQEINDLLAQLRVKQETKAYQAAVLYFDMKQYQAAVQAFERVLQDYPDTDRAEEIRFRIVDVVRPPGRQLRDSPSGASATTSPSTPPDSTSRNTPPASTPAPSPLERSAIASASSSKSSEEYVRY